MPNRFRIRLADTIVHYAIVKLFAPGGETCREWRITIPIISENVLPESAPFISIIDAAQCGAVMQRRKLPGAAGRVNHRSERRDSKMMEDCSDTIRCESVKSDTASSRLAVFIYGTNNCRNNDAFRGLSIMNDDFYGARARQVREIADRADPFTKKRLLELASR